MAGFYKTRYFTVATAGHVDHGKTSVIKALTGIDPDRLKEEKQRQMTIDLGFAHLQLAQGLAVGFIDVPGHGKFLKNMLAGVGGIDLALVVVAADEGPKPQTWQHLKILSLLNLKRVLVAVTKIDLVPSSRLEEAACGTRQILKQYGLEESGCVYLSCLEGKGINELKEALMTTLSLLPEREDKAETFLPIDRVFTKTGFGTVVTGTLVSGHLAVGDPVIIEPLGATARVRRIESLAQTVDSADAGQRVACNLVMKDNRALVRGCVLLKHRQTGSQDPLVSLSGWEGELKGDFYPDLSGQEIHLYHGTAECYGRIRWIMPSANLPQADAATNTTLLAQLSLASPLIACPGDSFVVRLSDETIYGGILLMRNRPRWLTRPRLQEMACCLLKEDYLRAIHSFIAASPSHMVKMVDLDRFLLGDTRNTAMEALLHAGQVAQLGEYLTTKAFCQKFFEQILAALSQEEHLSGVDCPTVYVPLERLRTKALCGLDRAAFQSLIEEMVKKGYLIRQAEKVALPIAQANAARNPASLLLGSRITQMLTSNVCLEICELARLLKVSPVQVRTALNDLCKSGKACVINYEYAALLLSVSKAYEVLLELGKENKLITPGDFRQRLGTSRKYAMAFLAYFDDQQITRRLPEGRVLLRMPADPRCLA